MTDELVKRLLDIASPLADEAAGQIHQLTAERDRLREALRDGRRLLAIAQDDRVRLLIQLEQYKKRHD